VSWVRVPAGSQNFIIMDKYKVIQYFQWGNLKLDKGQVILAEIKDNGNSLITVEHYPEEIQLVSTKSIESMIFLKKIERY